MFEIIDKEEQGSDMDTVIKVIGIGGAGGNAVDHMIREGVNGVDFIAANTDSQALARSVAVQRLQLGKTGLGAGAKPDAGRCAAMEERDAIAESLTGAHMVFITAGMGGGTGTGAAPIVAEVARELGVLTVAVVTKPFGFEGKRLKIAEEGIAELQKHVDSLIVILNDRLMDVLGDDVSMDDAFKAADNVLRNAVGGIAEIINFPGLVNVDFEDVRTVMGEMGMAMMGSANAAGVDRARIAAEKAVASPLLEGVNLSGAKGVLVNITATRSLKMKEVNEVMNTVRAFAAEDAHIIFGAVYDETIGDDIRVTVVATGLGQAAAKRQSFEVINSGLTQATGTDGRFANGQSVDYSSLDQTPAVFRKGRSATVEALANSGVDRWDIPAFLRKQAD
ncbi:cell division protein FtsZ [Accumulibacter sp.]|uniref:cell division protein FtsZ n=1 Tax=Accumulibacter sp. TaxID=2053492 RepID=UPI001D2C5C3C|nr:cell division protein FtsZ [Accumulibacter sp.]MCB1931314.1 cell division protein FtsZ [Accumulibacter sp.]MCP5230043.1 cell division protein FtsZ [Accumulibacter sp.]